MKPVAVLDTNQWVSACLKRVGVPARIIGLALDDRLELLTSPEIWEELIDVLRRPRVYRAILRHNVAVASCWSSSREGRAV